MKFQSEEVLDLYKIGLITLEDAVFMMEFLRGKINARIAQGDK